MLTPVPPVDLVFCKDEKTWLCSGLDEMMFGKTKFSLLLSDVGKCVRLAENAENYVFSDWKLSEITTAGERVFFQGNFNGLTLQQMIETEHPQLHHILFTICCIYSQAIREGITMPCNGATGILINLEKNEILFLPENAFDKSAANYGKKVYDFYQDCWRDYVASGRKALCFALGVMAYFAVTKALPFSEERDHKISDRNFLPAEYAVNGLNRKLADAIDGLLLGEEIKEFPLALLESEIFEGESRNHALRNDKFEEKVKKYADGAKNILKRKRFVRRNWPRFAAGFAFLVFAGIATVSIVHENGKKPTVIGLDSEQVTEVFYRGLHTMDTDLMLAAAPDCEQAQRYISQVPQLYVTGQMRSAYNFESGISTPENWFFFEPDTSKSYSHYIYGISNFTIDGKPDALDIKVPTRKNHPTRKLFAEDGSGKIEKNPDAEHTVRYFLVHNQDNQIEIEQYTTVVQLKYIKNRWQILKLDQVSSAEIQSPLPVSLAFKKALSEKDGNLLDAADAIRKEFYWVPTRQSLEIEKKKLDKIGY